MIDIHCILRILGPLRRDRANSLFAGLWYEILKWLILSEVLGSQNVDACISNWVFFLLYSYIFWLKVVATFPEFSTLLKNGAPRFIQSFSYSKGNNVFQYYSFATTENIHERLTSQDLLSSNINTGFINPRPWNGEFQVSHIWRAFHHRPKAAHKIVRWLWVSQKHLEHPECL